MIYDFDSNQINDAQVTIYSKNEKKEWVLQGSAVSDIHGRFLVSDVPFGLKKIEITKNQFEPVSFEFSFSEASQIVYTKVINDQQLIKKASDSLLEKNWLETRNYLDRADKIKANNPLSKFMRAMLLNQTGNPQDAEVLLLSIINDDKIESFPIYAYLGDLYFKKLSNKEAAVEYYKKALSIKYDANIQSTLEGIK